MKKRLLALTSAALVLALMLTSCGKASSGKQEITFALQNEPDGIDPCITANSFASPFLANVFEGLVTYDTVTGALIGGNAESWEISDDGLVYTFKLRDGLKWSDGTPITANDYVYTFLRILTPETTARYVAMIKDYVLNAKEFNEGNATAEEVGVKAIDDTTLEITLFEPTPFYIDILTMWTFSPVNEATITANGEKWTNKADTYVCNGPFKISEINMGESIVLVKNTEYYDADKVVLEKITFRYILDAATALTAYESDEIDGVRTISPSDVARLVAEDAGVVTAPAYSTTFFDINNMKAPFDNVLVRKAINLAVDRDSIINDVLQNGGTPAYSLVSPGYVVDGKDFVDGRSTFGLSAKADVKAAQAALAEAGYPDGKGFPEITVSYYSNDNAKKMAEAIAEMLSSNLNIKVNITSSDWAVFYEGIQMGNYEIAAMGWGADFLHPMSFMALMKTGDPNNHTGYANPEYDALVEAAKVETDPAKAMKLMQDAEAMAAEDYPLLNLFFRSNRMLMKNDIQGYYLSPSDHIYLKTASVNR